MSLEKEESIIMETPTKDDFDDFRVTLDDSEDPQCLPTLRKWLIVVIISLGTLLVTSDSPMVRESFVELLFVLTLQIRQHLLKLAYRAISMSQRKFLFFVSACTSPASVLVHYSLAHYLRCMAGISSTECRSSRSLPYPGQ